ncbi:MAG TPA: phosphate ABC transporter permease PstA [Actinomycetota bacterium]|jgi:phosphate transport system permease protein
MRSLVATDDVRAAVDAALRGQKRDVKGLLFKGVLLLTLLISLGVLIVLLWKVVADALPVFQDRGWSFVTSNTSPLPNQAGVRQGLIGSLILILFVTLLALPLGIAAAIYLQEYARDSRLNRILIANVRNLAGVPSIVYGILGLVVFVQAFRGFTGPGGGAPGYSYISGGLTLAVLVMPIVILVTMEALRAVPQSLREGAYGVGATRWEVTRSHVLPYAAPGMLTGAILALGRAFGETAPLLLVGATLGFFANPPGQAPLDLLQGFYTALPTQIFAWAKLPQAVWGANVSAAIVVLLVTILAVNAVAIVLRNRYDRKW